MQRAIIKSGKAEQAPGMSQASAPLPQAQSSRSVVVTQEGASADPRALQAELGPVRDEEDCLTNYPVELASISVKLLVDLLVRLGLCSSAEDVPEQLAPLLQECNEKSESAVEQEIYERFLRVSKELLDEQIATRRAVAPISEEGVGSRAESRHKEAQASDAIKEEAESLTDREARTSRLG